MMNPIQCDAQGSTPPLTGDKAPSQLTPDEASGPGSNSEQDKFDRDADLRLGDEAPLAW